MHSIADLGLIAKYADIVAVQEAENGQEETIDEDDELKAAQRHLEQVDALNGRDAVRLG